MACYTLTLTHSGVAPATVELHVTGVPVQWVMLSPARVTLQPGAQATLRATLTAPRLPTTVPGSYPLCFRLTSPDYPDAGSQHAAQFTLHPFDAPVAPAPKRASPSRLPPRLRATLLMAGLLALVGSIVGQGAVLPRAALQPFPSAEDLALTRPLTLPPVAIEPAWRASLPPPPPLPTLTPQPTVAPALPTAPALAVPEAKALVAASAPVVVAGSYEALFQQVGAEYGLDWRVLASLAYRESRLDPLAVGQDGERGLMQILPTTWDAFAPRVGVSDPFDPLSSVRVGAAYLVYLRDYLASLGYPDDYWSLVAYNWGPNNLRQLLEGGGDWGGVPWRTQDYVYTILQEVATPVGEWWQTTLRQPVPGLPVGETE